MIQQSIDLTVKGQKMKNILIALDIAMSLIAIYEKLTSEQKA